VKCRREIVSDAADSHPREDRSGLAPFASVIFFRKVREKFRCRIGNAETRFLSRVRRKAFQQLACKVVSVSSVIMNAFPMAFGFCAARNMASQTFAHVGQACDVAAAVDIDKLPLL